MSQHPQGRVVVVRRGHVVVPNQTVYDHQLSYAALGMLVVLLSRPEGAPMGYRALTGRGMGEKATREALNELSTAGYRHQFVMAAGRKGMRTDTVISEVPITRDQAEQHLQPSFHLVDNPAHRAAGGAARTDLRKRGVSAGGIARHVTQHDGSQPDGARHAFKALGSGSSLGSSPDPGKTTACARTRTPGAPCRNCGTSGPECEHGTPHTTACALCRAAVPKF